MALAADANISIDRAAEVQLAVELASTRGAHDVVGDHIELIVGADSGQLKFTLGPFHPGIAEAMIADQTLPSPGALLAVAAVRARSKRSDDKEFLHFSVGSASPVGTEVGATSGPPPK